MALKYRVTWMQIHTYFACFFMPLLLLYVTSGVLYLFDIKGGNKVEHHYSISLPNGWPKNEIDAKKVMLPVIKSHGHSGTLPSDYYHDNDFIGWYGYKQEVFLNPSQEISEAKLTVIEHDLLKQCLLIHKGHAGLLFWLSAIMLGSSLLLSAVTGVVLAFSMPKLKRSALLFSILGLASTVIGFIVSN